MLRSRPSEVKIEWARARFQLGVESVIAEDLAAHLFWVGRNCFRPGRGPRLALHSGGFRRFRGRS